MEIRADYELTSIRLRSKMFCVCKTKASLVGEVPAKGAFSIFGAWQKGSLTKEERA